MRNCGRHIVLLALTSLTLAACGGGGDEAADGAPGSTNLPPLIAGTPTTTLAAGSLYSFTPTAGDPNGDPLTFAATNVPTWATFSTSTGALTGTPTEAHVGMTEMITIEVSDSKAVTQLPAFRIQVSSNATTPPPDPLPPPPPPPAVNVAPTLSGTPAIIATVGVPYTFAPVGDDANNDLLTYSFTNCPSWMTCEPETGRVSGTPATANIGSTGPIVIMVSDGLLNAQVQFTLTVQAAPPTPPANQAPTISGTPATAVAVGNNYVFNPVGSDADGNPLSYSIQNQPSWAAFSTTTGRLTGRPAAANVGTSAAITISVSDGIATASLPSFTVRVVAQNTAPTLSGTPATTATVGQQYTFAPVGDDANDDPLTYSFTNCPTWMNCEAATGRVSGTPATANIGSTGAIVIRVSDGQASAQIQFTLTVQAAPTTPPANRAPTITGAPATTVTVGNTYTFTAVGSDPDGNTLTYSIQNVPAWATFSATTGRLTNRTGRPSAADVGISARITISVTDGTATASLPSFTIQVVAPANRAPTISGTPPLSINVLAPYSFQPSATDADGNTLTFSIQNRPAWASFSTSTGLLSGTPAVTDIATFSNIIISVSDGTASVSLPSFNLSVLQAATGSALISWTAPTTNTDGSTLSNLASYRVLYGRASTSLDQVTPVSNPGVTSFTVENLATGTWYFAVVAVNSAGSESDLSNVAMKTVN